MKLLYAIIPLIGITAAAELHKRSTCTDNGGTCVNTNDKNACSNGAGFLVTSLCPGSNSEICCFSNVGDSVCTPKDCVYSY
jgi:hypothetical protein